MKTTRFAKPLLLTMLPLLLSLCAPARIWSQANADDKLRSYYVVSIKPEDPDSGAIGIRKLPTGFEAYTVSLADLIKEAYSLEDLSLVKNVPDVKTHYHVTAKLGPDQMPAFAALSPQAQQQKSREMLQALLAERFHLAVHHGQQPLDVYSLVVDRKGLKLKEVTGDSGDGGQASSRPAVSPFIGDGKITGIFSMGQFAHVLSIAKLIHIVTSARPILDNTGLTGKYLVDIAWVPLSGSQDTQRSQNPEVSSTFESALAELGLRLVPQKAQVDTILVDHAEPPAFD